VAEAPSLFIDPIAELFAVRQDSNAPPFEHTLVDPALRHSQRTVSPSLLESGPVFDVIGFAAKTEEQLQREVSIGGVLDEYLI